MPGLLPQPDPDGLQEFSVVYTDRSLNHMSRRFIAVMQDVLEMLRSAYNGHTAVIVPGSGSFGMEAVARQFVSNQPVLIVRNGWFSYRWSQILETAQICGESTVMVCKAKAQDESEQAAWAPLPAQEVAFNIRAIRPAVVFAPHCETASGILLPDDYIQTLADAAHEVGALMVLDCIASGAHWIDMEETDVDVLISAPQKSWSSSPCCAMVVLSERARKTIEITQSSSFSCDLKKWMEIAESYAQGKAAYHATMPTDSLARLRDAMQETREAGYEMLASRQTELGGRVRELLAARGFPSVAAAGFESPAVVVSHTRDAQMKSGVRFASAGIQTAAGVPLMCDESESFSSFRIGLFGLDKWRDVDGCVARLKAGLDRLGD